MKSPPQEEDHALAGEDLPQGLPHPPRAPLGKKKGQDDAGHLQEGHQAGHEPLRLFPRRLDKGEGGEEGDGGDGTVVGGQGGGIVAAYPEEAAGQGIGQKGPRHPKEQGGQGGEGHLGQGGVGELHPALKPDGEEEVDGKGGVEGFGEGEVAPDEPGESPQEEGQHHGGKQVEADEL